MNRRRFVAGSVGLTASLAALGCSGVINGASTTTSGASPTDFALRNSVPGFRDVGAWTGDGPAPVLVTLMLNINDFMRADLEAAAVSRWLDLADELDLWPLELSFTGHVLTAFVEQAPELVSRIKAARPTIAEHYRILKHKRLQSVERELFYTDPASLALDRSRPGPCVLIQQQFGVTPRDEGDVLAELLRRRWTQGGDSAELRALGAEKRQRQDQIAHPDRVIGQALPDIAGKDAHDHVEAYLRVRRQHAQLLAGQTPSLSGAEQARMAQLAHEQGFDLSGMAGIDTDALPDFIAGFSGVTGAGGADSSVLRGLAERSATLPTVSAELAFKLGRLNPDRVYATRLAWHASNDYTAEAWGTHMAGSKGQKPLPLTPAGQRDSAQQAAIQAEVRTILKTLAGHPRVRVASVDNDTQWAAGNSAAQGYRDVFGVELDRLPGSLSATTVEAKARAAGLKVSSSGGGRKKRR